MDLTIRRKAPYKLFVIGIILLCFNVWNPADGNCSQIDETTALKTIVIDPGHGGDNHGTQSSRGILEKDLTLKLAQITARYLRHQFNVLLTRNNDRDLPLSDRTALANHHKADLFVSIHMGGGFSENITGSTVMYFSAPKKKFFESEMQIKQLTGNDMDPATKWKNIQLKHIPVSRGIAETLCSELKSKSKLISPSINSAPLYVLTGADMPAIYIEPFFISNPDMEKLFQDPENLQQLAIDLSAGIIAAMQKNPAASRK